MIRIFLIIITFMFCIGTSAFADGTYTLKTGISYAQKVSVKFFGSWRVTSKLVSTTDYKTFKPQSIDAWNLSRTGDVIRLENPFTGANADVDVDFAEGNFLNFTKRGVYENQILTDTVKIKVDGNKFSGYNDLKLETLSVYDKKVIKTARAKYEIKGEKVSGTGIR